MTHWPRKLMFRQFKNQAFESLAYSRSRRTHQNEGVRAISTYLHDGRANSLGDAIRAHDGEAAIARNRYLRLTFTQRQNLFDFLNSL